MNNSKFRKLLGRWVALSLVFCLMIGLAGCGNSSLSDDLRDSGSSSEQDSGSREDREQDETQEEEPEQQVVTGTTPEETLEVFFKALSEQDVETMMACCYVEDYLDRVSFSQYTDLMQSYMPNGNISAPTEYDYYRELVSYELRARYARAFKKLALSLMATDVEYEDLLNDITIQHVDRKWAKEFSRTVDPEALKDLEVLSIDEDRPDMQNDAKVKDNFRKSTGADDCVERTALLEMDGQLFYKGFTLAEIDGHWQIYVVSALLLGENSNGTATPVESKQDYRDIIA